MADQISACCGAPIDLLASVPLCVRCNGKVTREGLPLASKHVPGHNERCGMTGDDNPAASFKDDDK